MDNSKPTHGGYRPGAGRKPKSGIPGDNTVIMRVPENDKAAVVDFLQARWRLRDGSLMPEGVAQPVIDPIRLYLPLFSNRIPAGFPSPADDHIEDRIDLNEELIRNPPATFMIRVEGNSMIDANIFEGDILIVDRSIEARDGHVIVAVVDGKFTVKRLSIKHNKVRLMPENPAPAYKPIEFQDGQELIVWGVVTNVIHPVK
jgi:DNA polymerase V